MQAIAATVQREWHIGRVQVTEDAGTCTRFSLEEFMACREGIDDLSYVPIRRCKIQPAT